MFQGRVIPSSDQLSIESWETRARLGTGSLLAAGCHGVMMLAGKDEETQTKARELGHSLALAIRAHDEKIMFTEDNPLSRDIKSLSHSSKNKTALLILASRKRNLIIAPELLEPRSGKLIINIFIPNFADRALASIVLPVPLAP